MTQQTRSGSATRELGMRQAPHGVTLLELLTVVIVVGILAALAVPQYFQAQERVRSAAALEALGAIRSSQWRFRAHVRGMTGGTETDERYTGIAANLDFNVPDAGSGWTYVVCQTAKGAACADREPIGAGTAGPNATATRGAGNSTGAIIAIDLNTGNLCGMNDLAAVYALRAATDC